MRNPRHRASLAVRRMGIETQQEYVVYMHRDCHVCRSEGFEAQTRVLISLNGRSIIATLNVVDPTLLELGRRRFRTARGERWRPRRATGSRSRMPRRWTQ